MKKIILTVITFTLLSLAIYSAPFGLKMGMSLEEITKQCEEEPVFAKDDIYIVKPIKRHPLFEYYAVYINEKVGLYQIRAISESVTCNKYGTEIQNSFNSVKDRISKVYGTPKINDEVDTKISSYLQTEEYWFRTLNDGSRNLAAIWGKNTELSDDLTAVILECLPDSDNFINSKAHLLLCYYFNNGQSVEDEQDEVF